MRLLPKDEAVRRSRPALDARPCGVHRPQGAALRGDGCRFEAAVQQSQLPIGPDGFLV